MAKVVVLLAEGFEDIEAITIIDILRRGGVDVTTASIGDKTEVLSAHNVPVKADRLLFDVLDDLFDMVVLPGGLPGSEHLKKSSIVEKFVRSHFEEGHFIGAICAAPMALGAFGILQNKKATCYPGFESHLKGAEIQNTAVCVDGKVITSQGPATSPVFAFELLKLLGEEKSADGLRDGMLYSRVLK